jgi:hypothetical protein
MENLKETLVIYRLKFKSKPDYENAVKVFRYGEKMRTYVESFQRSFLRNGSQTSYDRIIPPPEINYCVDDLVIYVCSYELRQSLTGSTPVFIGTKGAAERIPRLPYYYELFLKGSFGSIANLSVTAAEPM